jgi:hypothetical protein
MKLVRAVAVPFAMVLLAAGGIAALLRFNDTAREVVGDSLKNVFMVVSTPFIFESIAASVFLLGLLAYNRWRLHREGDGWVYLVIQENAGGKAHSVILPHKPDLAHEDEDEAGVIEGYLELGLAAQALEELNQAEAEAAQNTDSVLLRIRVLAANLDTNAALALLHETAADHPETKTSLALGAEQTASWMRAHLPTHADEAKLWENEAARLKQT